MLIAAILFGTALAQPIIKATPADCSYAERKCIATDKAIQRRAADKQFDSYCGAWKDACLKANLHWDRRR